MTKIIGLTGGIGSGKTTVANFFKALGVPVFIADEAGKQVMEDKVLQNKIRSVFEFLSFENSVSDRKKLAQIVFDDADKLVQLNAIVHPEIEKLFEEWFVKQNKAKFVVYEAAILFESGSYKKCDKIITVTAPQELKIKRILSRDNSSREQILQRMSVQWSDEVKIDKSNFVIDNQDIEKTKKQVNDLFEVLNTDVD